MKENLKEKNSNKEIGHCYMIQDIKVSREN